MGDQLRRSALGIDLGARSVGWALVELDENGEGKSILAMGSRVFEAGVEGDIERGKDESRAKQRREKRQQRRMLFRRAQRLRTVARTLLSAGLLPEGRWANPCERHNLVTQLDAQLRPKWIKTGDRVRGHLLPYLLRAAAVKEKLEPYELGRALYHLAQRRGYKSNRKTERKERQDGTDEKAGESKKENLGAVEGGIKDLREAMAAANCRYLGEYFATLDPEAERRIRQRWTSREMSLAEFDAIITTQRAHYPQQLTEENVRAIRRAIFFQRPLRSAKGLVGKCSLEPGKRRAALALPIAQRFRMLAAVNNLEVIEPTGVMRPLAPTERTQIVEALEREGGLTFEALRKLLGWKPTKRRKDMVTPGYEFNLERGGETRLPGDRTGSKLRAVFGDRWIEMPEEETERLVYEVLNLESADAVERRGRNIWGLEKEAAARLAALTLEEGYAAYSKIALKKLVQRMEDGTRLKTAEGAIYGEQKIQRDPLPTLPPVLSVGLDVRNPAVMRSLSELRKVINGIVRKFGKPDRVVIELARDIKKPRKAREEIARKNREREASRDKAADQIVREAGIKDPRAGDIEKWLLAQECGMQCPYTGKTITPETLYGDHAQFDIEHIIPLSICLDNRLVNKTLCHADFNRHAKHERIPFEAFDTGSEAWRLVLERVKRMNGPMAREKLRRFQMTMEQVKEEYGDDFTQRHLADTAFGAKLAAEYIGLLYGGINDGAGKRHVFTSPGTATGHLRNEWQVNAILGGRDKNRRDHRHHAIDAAVIAVTTPRIVKALSDAAKTAQAAGRRMFAPVKEPWKGFIDHLRAALENIVVSHRMDHRVGGPLHAETNYSPKHKIIDAKSGQVVEAHLKRMMIWQLSHASVEDIVDKAVREAVKKALNGGDPKKVFKIADRARPGDAGLPCLKTEDGRLIPIRKVRVRENKEARGIGKALHRRRFIMSGADTLHHTVIVARQTRRGEEWTDEPADRMTVHERLSEDSPAVKTDWGAGAKPVMVIHKGDCLEMNQKNGSGRAIFVVRSVSRGDLTIRLVHDARQVDEIKRDGERDLFRIRSGDELRRLKAVKVEISPIGEVAYVKNGV